MIAKTRSNRETNISNPLSKIQLSEDNDSVQKFSVKNVEIVLDRKPQRVQILLPLFICLKTFFLKNYFFIPNCILAVMAVPQTVQRLQQVENLFNGGKFFELKK